MIRTDDPLAQVHFGSWSLRLNKIGKRSLVHTKFQASKPSGSEENFGIFFYVFSMYFYGLKLGPLARSHLAPWDLHLNKIGKGPLGNAKYQISNI